MLLAWARFFVRALPAAEKLLWTWQEFVQWGLSIPPLACPSHCCRDSSCVVAASH